jgi:hypothetical protein
MANSGDTSGSESNDEDNFMTQLLLGISFMAEYEFLATFGPTLPN